MSKNKHIHEAKASLDVSVHDLMSERNCSNNNVNFEQLNRPKGIPAQFCNNSQPITLPPSLKPHTWKRPHEIINREPIIYSSSSTNKYPNLLINNQHLLVSHFMRWFISSVTFLSYYDQEGFDVMKNASFPWDCKNKPWHGSLYIYPINEKTADTLENSQIDHCGQYVIKLFFMGCWQSIEIDDLIPLNSEGKCLLPRTENNQELWSILLAKGMLKIAALSWTVENEVNDFNPITCLTDSVGWTCLSLNINHLSPNDRWKLLSKYSESRKLSDTTDSQSIQTENEENTQKRQEKLSMKEKKIRQSKNQVTEKKKFSIMTFLCISNATNDLKELPDGIIPNYPAYVEYTCDISSNPALIKPPLESWKFHRWLPWAMRQGIIDPTDYFIPIRRIFLLNPTNAALINEEKKLSSICLDFNKLSDYPMDIYFFFKLKYFKCSINVADVFPDELHEDKREKLNMVSRVSTKQLKRKKFDDMIQIKKHYEYNHSGIQSRNEPLYLLIDSIHSKFLLFNFSTFSQPGRNSFLIIEQHCWFKRSLVSNALLEIKTMATTSKALCLKPGRHLLRIFCQSKNSYHFIISSDTNFQIGNRREIQKLMQSESKRTKILATRIINSMNDAFNSFGTSNYSVKLKNFYRSYMPEGKKNHLQAHSFKLIHHFFIQELINLIIVKLSDDSLEALRIFFRDPTIKKNSKSYYDYNNSQNLEPNPSINDICEEFGEVEQDYHDNRMIMNAAMTIQSFWRMARINLYKKIHDVNHKRHKSIQEILHQILLIVTDLNTVCHIMRNIIRHKECFPDLYPCSDDFQNVLDIQEINGSLSSIAPHQWIPIVRLTLNVPMNVTVFACLDLFIDLPSYILQVFNNDTGHEIQRIVNNVIPFHYQRKTKGYTVLGYGWSQNNRSMELNWSLHLTTRKGDPQFTFFHNDQPIISPFQTTALQIYELSNIYIPNVNNLIFKAILKIPSGSWITLRVRTTYEKVAMRVRIRNNNDKIVTEVFGGSTIILPIVHLEIGEDEWIIDAIASPNSWPLTVDEWNIVENTKKTTIHQIKIIKQSTESLKKITKSQQVTNNAFATPRWYLQVVTDGKSHVQLYQNLSRDIEIQQIKDSWDLNNTNRINHGTKLRNDFLHHLYMANASLKQNEFSHDEYRSLKPPQVGIIPSLDLSTYFIHTQNENRRVKTELDEELDKITCEQIMIDFKGTNFKFIEQSCNLLHELQLDLALSSRIPTKRNT